MDHLLSRLINNKVVSPEGVAYLVLGRTSDLSMILANADGNRTVGFEEVFGWMVGTGERYEHARTEGRKLARKVSALEDELQDASDDIGACRECLDHERRWAQVETLFEHVDRIQLLRQGAFTSTSVTVDDELDAIATIRREVVL